MKKLILTITLVVASLLTSACSNQYRNASTDLPEEDIMEKLETMGLDSGSSSVFSDLMDGIEGGHTVIYFADAPSSLGPVWSVLSIHNGQWGFLDNEIESTWDLNEATVILLDGFDNDDNRRFALAIEAVFVDTDRPILKTWTSEVGGYTLGDDEFFAKMPMDDGRYLFLRSFDVHKTVADELGGVIQLKLSIGSGLGDEHPIGKISTLVGFE